MRVLVRSVFAIAFLSLTLLAQQPLTVVAAYWGAGPNFMDVTERVRTFVRGDALETRVSDEAMGVDPFPQTMKVLRIYYLQNGQFNQGEWPEGMVVRIGNVRGGRGDRRDFDGGRRARVLPLRIERAVYGYGNQVKDVTALLQSRVANNRLDFPVQNGPLGGDPAVGRVKQLQVTYDWAGQAFDIVANENDLLHLPDGVSPAGGTNAAPGAPPDRYQRLRIVKAQFGSAQANRLIDVTDIVQRNVAGDRIAMQVTRDGMGGNPAGRDNNLYIIYTLDNGPQLGKTIPEGQSFTLP